MSRFKKGDRVLLSTEGIRDTAVTNLGAIKLSPCHLTFSSTQGYRLRLYAGHFLIVATAPDVLRLATERVSPSYALLTVTATECLV